MISFTRKPNFPGREGGFILYEKTLHVHGEGSFSFLGLFFQANLEPLHPRWEVGFESRM